MAKCNFDWSMCTTCANAGSSLCPLDNHRTIKNLKRRMDELEEKIERFEYKIGQGRNRRDY